MKIIISLLSIVLLLLACTPNAKKGEQNDYVISSKTNVIDTLSTKKYLLKGGSSILVNISYHRDDQAGSMPIRYMHDGVDTLLSEYGTALIDSMQLSEFLNEYETIPIYNYLWPANFRDVYDFDDYFILEERAGSNIYFDLYRKKPLEQMIGGGYGFVVDTVNQFVLFQGAYDYYCQVDELQVDCDFFIFDMRQKRFYPVNGAFDDCNSSYLLSPGYASIIEIAKVTSSEIHLRFDGCKHVVKRQEAG